MNPTMQSYLAYLCLCLWNNYWRLYLTQVIFSSLIGRLPDLPNGANKVLILAHRRELLLQAKQQLARISPNLRVEIECADERADVEKADVVVASVQSLGRKGTGLRRLERYDPKLFKCIVVDEAHHTAAPTYGLILAHFGFKKLTNSISNFITRPSPKNAALRQSIQIESYDNAVDKKEANKSESNMLLCGFSATFLRNDALTLASQYQDVVYHLPIVNLIKEGYLCEVNTTMIGTSSSIREVKQQAGDYKMSELSLAIDTPNRNKLVAQIWYDHARVVKPGQQLRNSTIVFGLNVQHVENLFIAFAEIAPEVRCEIIHAKTPVAKREQILHDFAVGKLPVLLNCAVLTEGFDLPNTDCIVMTRPTCNPGLYIQMVGRGLRKNSESKRDCLVLDFVDEDNGSKRTLQTFPTLMAGEGGDITDEYNSEVDRRVGKKAKAPGVEVFNPKKKKFVKDIDEDVSLSIRAANLITDGQASPSSYKTFRYGKEEFGPTGQVNRALDAAQAAAADPGPPGYHLSWSKLDKHLYMSHSEKLILVFQYHPFNVTVGRVFEVYRDGKSFEWMPFSDFNLEWEPIEELLDDVVDVLSRDDLLHLHLEDALWRKEDIKFENNPRMLNELMKLSGKVKGTSLFHNRDSSVGWTVDVMLKYDLRQKYLKRKVTTTEELLEGVPRYGRRIAKKKPAAVVLEHQRWNVQPPPLSSPPGWQHPRKGAPSATRFR